MFGNVKGRVRTVHYNVWCAKTAFIHFFAGWRVIKEAQRKSARNFKFNLARLKRLPESISGTSPPTTHRETDAMSVGIHGRCASPCITQAALKWACLMALLAGFPAGSRFVSAAFWKKL